MISHLSCFNFDLWVFKVGLSMFWFCLVYIFVAAFSSLVTCVFLASTYACQFFSICFYFFDLGRIDGQCLCSSYFVINIVLDQFDWSVLLEKYSAWMIVHCPFWLVKGHHRDLLSLVCKSQLDNHLWIHNDNFVIAHCFRAAFNFTQWNNCVHSFDASNSKMSVA